MAAHLGDETAHRDDESGPRDHRGLRVLTLDECVRYLRATLVGRIAFLHEGEPVIFPVNYAVDGLDVVFRSTWGSKLEHAQHAGTVAFEVDGSDDEQRLGWSVLVNGVADVVYDEQESDRLDRLALRGLGEDHRADVLGADPGRAGDRPGDRPARAPSRHRPPEAPLARAAQAAWQRGHQNRLRPAITWVATGVRHTRQGSPVRR